MESKLSRWCDGLIEAGWLAAIVALPLFFNIHSSRVFEPDKLTLLRSIALLMATAWLVRFIDVQGWRDLKWLGWSSPRSIWRQPFILAIFLIAVIYVLSTAFSVTPFVSWAGSYQRLQGTYTTLSYLVVFALLAATLRTRAQVERVITAVIVTSIPISLYAILQRIGHDPLPWGGDVQRRVAGHMGNAIFIAAYLIMAVFPTAARIIDAFSNILGDEELSYADVIRSAIYIFALVIQAAAIYWTFSRGPWIGLLVGTFAFVLILLVNLRNSVDEQSRFQLREVVQALALVFVGIPALFYLFRLYLGGLLAGRFGELAGPTIGFIAFSLAVGIVFISMLILVAARRGWRWLWLSWIGLALFLAGWLVAFNLADRLIEPYGRTPVVGGVVSALHEWRDLPAIGRLGRLLEADQGTGKVRVLIWQGALALIQPHEPLQFPDGGEDRYNWLRPLIGYGPESMYVVYNRFYPPELATVEARNASPDRSHNETFDALVITGAIGFLVWQFLYLSVFYYGLRWLGVVRSNRDRNLLIAFWLGGAIVATVLLVVWLGPVYFGVALPFGSIGGLVLYLIYYALFSAGAAGDQASQLDPDEAARDPFRAERLLMVALVAAVAAHYIEIHFGIAIAATRLYFFVYTGLMFVIGHRYQMSPPETAVVETAVPTRRRRSRSVAADAGSGGWTAPVLSATLILGLMVAILSYNYINLSTRPGETFATVADVPTAFEFVQRSFLEKEGQPSPYIFMVIVLSWGLGVLLYVSEMVKDGALSFDVQPGRLKTSNRQLAGAAYLVLAIIGLALAVAGRAEAAASVNANVSSVLMLTGAGLALWGSLVLLLGVGLAQLMGGGLAIAALSLAIPFLFTGSVVVGLILAVAGGLILYLLWDNSWINSMAPSIYLALLSMGAGMFFAVIHAVQVRSVILPLRGVPEDATAATLRVLEADRAASVLTVFYLFGLLLLLIHAYMLAQAPGGRVRAWGAAPAFVALGLLLPLALYLASVTNLRVIQADITYKRAGPWEQQASRNRDPNLWQSAVATYEHAIDKAPTEDFYYLFLGRAYLEQSAVTEDPAERVRLLATAEERLARAQDINPLNTDHTANLARLNVRWAGLTQGEERQEHFEAAVDYYEDAILLSPNNAVIRNEYAAIVFSLGDDCDEAIALYEASAAVDPFYVDTRIRLASAYLECARQKPEADQSAYYDRAAETLEDAVTANPREAGRLLQELAQVYQRIGELDKAIERLAAARPLLGEDQVWRIDLGQALLYRDLGDTAQARELAQQALETAPVNQQSQVQSFLLQLDRTEAFDLEGERSLAQLDPAARNNFYDAYPPFVIDTQQTYEAIIHTVYGEIRLRLYASQAPLAVNNFVYLASQGFYDDTTFHRVLEGFVVQGGDPLGSGVGGPGYAFDNEIVPELQFNRRGLVGMANAGPNTNGSQFFITLSPQPSLTGSYTIFGEVVAGDTVLDQLRRRDPQSDPGAPPGDLIERIEIVTGS